MKERWVLEFMEELHHLIEPDEREDISLILDEVSYLPEGGEASIGSKREKAPGLVLQVCKNGKKHRFGLESFDYEVSPEEQAEFVAMQVRERIGDKTKMIVIMEEGQTYGGAHAISVEENITTEKIEDIFQLWANEEGEADKTYYWRLIEGKIVSSKRVGE